MTTKRASEKNSSDADGAKNELTPSSVTPAGSQALQGSSTNALPANSVTPMDLIAQAAANPDFDVDKLDRLMQLQERYEANQAEKAFAQAMANFQSTVPAIHRSKKADRYTYAPIEDIMQVIRPHLDENGLSVTFGNRRDGDDLIVTCTVLHRDGHAKTNEFTVPIDRENRTRLTVMQVQGSVDSYGKRYALGAALGLVYSDEDDDGAAVYERVTLDQATVITDTIKELGLPKSRVTGLLRWCKAASVEDIAADRYEDVIKQLTKIRDEGH